MCQVILVIGVFFVFSRQVVPLCVCCDVFTADYCRLPPLSPRPCFPSTVEIGTDLLPTTSSLLLPITTAFCCPMGTPVALPPDHPYLTCPIGNRLFFHSFVV